VYGPGYVDEFVLESQKSGSAQQDFYVLQDANFNVMALTDANGGVVEQYQWEPYGLLAAKDTDTGGTIPHSHIGHQGLFFYRFNPQTGDTATLSTTAVGLYHNRNRWYSPNLGRFTSRDPNETAAMILLGHAMHAGHMLADASAFRPESHFSNGMNLLVYLGGNPVGRSDPAGLFSFMNVMGTTALQMDLMSQEADVSVSLLKAIGGLAQLGSTRNRMLDDLLGVASSPIDTSGIDFAVSAYNCYQHVQSVALGIGFFKAGASFAKYGVTGLIRLVKSKGHHTIPMWAGGNKSQLLYRMFRWGGGGGHRQLERRIRERISAKFGFHIGGRGGSMDDWMEHMMENPSLQESVFEELADIYREWDRSHQTSLSAFFEMNLFMGNFTSY